MPQRLCIFLDGTWNTEDDSTNVLHGYNLTRTGLCEDGWTQVKHYDRGVGTKQFDKVTGGVFGRGLDKNIREAYNWLIHKYHMGDEIYIFGFSRGAYSVRSLVGLIRSQGLLLRGSPITVAQLWDRYMKADSSTMIENRFRHTNVKITYIGIYDTVSAMGIGSLGLPGLISKKHAYHRTKHYKFIQSCRHAIAIDEHRRSFNIHHYQFYKHHKDTSPNTIDEVVEQRWFPGAHSNIGGGYEDNYLSMAPLRWIMKGANQAGLITNQLKAWHINDTLPRDSLSEFLSPFGTHFLREKRNYRHIGTQIDHRPNANLVNINEKLDKQVLRLANAEDTYRPKNLVAYLQQQTENVNITEDKNNDYSKLRSILDKLSDCRAQSSSKEFNGFLKLITAPKQFIYESSTSILGVWCLVLWSLIVGLGWYQLMYIINGGHLIEDSIPSIIVAVLSISVLAIIFDLLESMANQMHAYEPHKLRYDIAQSIFFWIRIILLISFLFGTAGLLLIIFKTGWSFLVDGFPPLSPDFHWRLLSYPLAISGLVMLGLWHYSASWKKRTAIIIHSLAAASFLCFIMVVIAYLPKVLNPSPQWALGTTASIISIALASILLGGFWAGEMMGPKRADIGSILSLQFTFSKSKVEEVLTRWRARSPDHWIDLVRKSIYRDAWGYVPLWSLAFIVIAKLYLSITCQHLSSIPGCGIEFNLVLLVIGFTLCLDQLENFIQVRFFVKRKRIEILTNNDSKEVVKLKANSILVFFAGMVSLLKNILFAIMFLASTAVLLITFVTFVSSLSSIAFRVSGLIVTLGLIYLLVKFYKEILLIGAVSSRKWEESEEWRQDFYIKKNTLKRTTKKSEFSAEK